MQSENEQGLKWWIRYVIVPLVVALIGGGGLCSIVAVLLSYFLSTNSDLTKTVVSTVSAVIIPTNTPITSPIPITPTPARTTKYEFVTLQHIGVYNDINLGLEAGIQTLGNIDFEIGWLVTTRSQDTSNSIDQITLSVSEISNQVSRVHFLLQGGWVFISNNTEIGTITLIFADGRRIDEPLKIGYNIRDWSKVSNPLVASNTQQAWIGMTSDQKMQGVVDIITINVPVDYYSTYIVGLEIKDLSMEKLNSLNPAIHLWAITMER